MAVSEILRTARLVLRDAGPKDVCAVHALASDFEVVRGTGTWPWPADRAFTEMRCRPIARENGFGGVVLYNNQLVGMMSIFGKGELGYMFARDHWGKGFASEMGRAVVQEAFARGDWSELEACVFADNPASAGVLKKLGFDEGASCLSACASRDRELPSRHFTLSRPRA